MTEQRPWTPIPDPTTLTNDAIRQVTEQYQRELMSQRELLQTRIDNLRMILDERYATQTKALDAAFVAAEKATATALASAEKAVGVAATSNEARFQQVNEFRKTLSDQATTFLPRAEYSAAHKALEDKFGVFIERVNGLELRLTSRLDTTGGVASGANEQRNETRLNLGIIAGFGTLLIALLTFVILYATKK
jgi:hypothetical protein